ncbi:MAG: aldo/keto reductase [Erysipelothrix sp.]|nr:aldo/keto reductase [Erysipelothrix sp.]
MITQKLLNGVEIPAIGLGTWKIPNDQVADIIVEAIKIGYRHIDTASIYKNEEGVGEGIRRSGINRSDIFVTTKVWNDDQGFQTTLKAFDKSLERLGLDYVDLYLIHWPKPLNAETWRALEQLYNQGKVRAIGVSNFHPHHFDVLLQTAKIKPMINQFELHPKLTQETSVLYYQNQGVVIESWSPLMRGQLNDSEILLDIAKKHSKTPAQIVLRWNMEKGYVTIPKTVKVERLKENIDIFDFKLDANDIQRIDSMNANYRTGPDPDLITF